MAGSQRPTFQAVWVRPLGTLFLWAVALVLLLRFLESVAFIAMMLLLAGSIAALLYPVAQRLPGPRWVRGSLTGGGFLLVLVGAVVGLGWLLKGVVRRQIEQWPQLRDSLNGTLAGWSQALGIQNPLTVEQLRDQAVGWLTSGGGDLWTQAMDSLGAVLVGLLLLAFGSIYFLAEPRRSVTEGIERLLGGSGMGRAQAFRGAAAELPGKLRWWLLGVLMSATITATASTLGYSLVGLNFAPALGLLTGLAEFVPTLGPATAFLVALLVASTQGPTQVVGVAVVYAVVQVLESYVILPLVMKRAVHVPPLVTLFTIVLWGRLLGPLGLVLAIPINLTIWTAVDHFWLRRSGA